MKGRGTKKQQQKTEFPKTFTTENSLSGQVKRGGGEINERTEGKGLICFQSRWWDSITEIDMRKQ